MSWYSAADMPREDACQKEDVVELEWDVTVHFEEVMDMSWDHAADLGLLGQCQGEELEWDNTDLEAELRSKEEKPKEHLKPDHNTKKNKKKTLLKKLMKLLLGL